MNGRAPDQGTATVPPTAAIFAYEPGEQLPLLPELERLPQAPKPGTHPHRVLRLLAQGRALTHPDYIEATDSWRLAAYVGTLKKRLGWPVLVAEIPAPCEAAPNRHIAVYSLAQRGRAIAAEIL
jgi:hypothetical protein